MSQHASEVHLVARPIGEPKPSDFALVCTTVAPPEEGQVVVRNEWISVDPYMRGRMNDAPSYVPPFVLGRAMEGGAVGTVIASRSAALPVGTVVEHHLGWRTHAVLAASEAGAVDVRRADRSAYLGVLGLTGFTAYVALKAIAPVAAGDTVFVSGAAGGVGVAAVTIAKALGAGRVVGSAGGPDKCARLVDEFGYDAAIDYKQGDLRRQLGQAAPDGIDVYLDNVGGEHLQVAIGALHDHGRIALCGAISQYNSTEPVPGPSNLAKAISKRLTLRGFIVFDHQDLLTEYRAAATDWLASGTISDARTTVDGIENAVDAFLGLSRGANVGKMLVRLPAP
jgi:NADPH-dependent curcumin reductase CurA